MDEEEDYIFLGTAVKQVDEGEALPKAGGDVSNQSARDKQGRERFHGAFTGGFSAGYYNSVGSKEGWAPKDFKSSRQGRAESHQQTPEEFMDDEDFGEFGIARRQVRASGGFDRADVTRKRHVDQLSGGLLSQALLETLVIPSSVPIGEQLLGKMGWKHGQGVGPRERREGDDEKVYGCSWPAHLGAKAASEFAGGLTFAPEDVATVSFQSKANRHGIGYSGIDKSRISGFGSSANSARDSAAPPTLNRRRGMTGQAFGVGALNDDDDDVYGQLAMSAYDTVLDDGFTDHNFGWTAPKGMKKASRFEKLQTESSKPLNGFVLSTAVPQPKLTYPAPPLPAGFRPYHRFAQKAPTLNEMIKSLAPVEKGLMLGQKLGSVFDLISKEDQHRISEAKSQISSAVSECRPHGQTAVTVPVTALVPVTVTAAVPVPVVTVPAAVESISSPRNDDTTIGKTPASVGRNVGTPSRPARDVTAPSRLGQLTAVGFDPFASDPAKADRYRRFRDLQTQGADDAYAGVCDGGLTEWEREREREEFTRAAKLYGPLSSIMAARFTPSQHDDQHTGTMEPEAEDDRTRAAKMKMFGKLTRQILTWHPDKILCRRFNIASPFPESDVVGVPQAGKRDKFSVWNYLGITQTGDDPTTSQHQPSTDRPKVAFAVGVAKKPGMTEITKPRTSARRDNNQFSIFSDLPETSTKTLVQDQAQTSAVNVDMEQTASVGLLDQQTNVVLEDRERPPMDLFKAIFDETSSSDDSDSENDDTSKKTQIKTKPETEITQPNTDSIGSSSDKEKETVDKVSNVETTSRMMSSSVHEKPDLSRIRTASKFSVFDDPKNSERLEIKPDKGCRTSLSEFDHIGDVPDDDSAQKSSRDSRSSVIGQVESSRDSRPFVIGQVETAGDSRESECEERLPTSLSGGRTIIGPVLPPDLLNPQHHVTQDSGHGSFNEKLKSKKHKGKSSKKKKKHKSKEKVDKHKKHKNKSKSVRRKRKSATSDPSSRESDSSTDDDIPDLGRSVEKLRRSFVS